MIQIKPIAITMGDPAGIGGDTAIKNWYYYRNSLPVFFLIDNPNRIIELAKVLSLNIKIQIIDHPDQAKKYFTHYLPILPIQLNSKFQVGEINIENTPCIIKSIKIAAELAHNKLIAGIVTNPTNKHIIKKYDSKHCGQTELIAQLDSKKNAVMMLKSDNLKVVPLTRHIAIKQVSSSISQSLIINTVKILYQNAFLYCKNPNPKIAISALNPHAGEQGSIGDEEINIITPAIKELQKAKYQVSGPHPADTLFAHNIEKYQIIICMYHDQALIPIKLLNHFTAANITLGLSFIRTSPDHGTAFTLSGTNKVNYNGLKYAIMTCQQMYLNSIQQTNNE